MRPTSIPEQRAAARIRRFLVPLLAAVAVISAATVALTLPPEASVWGGTGVALGVALLLAALGTCVVAWARVRGKKTPTEMLGMAVVALFCLVIGGSIVAGNYRIAELELTVDRKQSRIQPGSRGSTTVYEMWAEGDRYPLRITRPIYDRIKDGDRLRCTGAQPPLLDLQYTRCGPVNTAG